MPNHPHGNTSWTPDKTAKVKAMLETGATAGEVALKLKLTRAAVIGKARRMGWKMASGLNCGRNAFAPKEPRPSIAPERVPNPAYKLDKRKRGMSDKREAKSRPEDRREPGSVMLRSIGLICEPVDILDLKPSHCRWPIDQGQRVMFCGAQRDGERPYCSSHAVLAFHSMASLRMRA